MYKIRVHVSQFLYFAARDILSQDMKISLNIGSFVDWS